MRNSRVDGTAVPIQRNITRTIIEHNEQIVVFIVFLLATDAKESAVPSAPAGTDESAIGPELVAEGTSISNPYVLFISTDHESRRSRATSSGEQLGDGLQD